MSIFETRHAYQGLQEELKARLNKKITVRRQRSKAGMEPWQTETRGRLVALTPSLVVIERTDFPKQPNSDYKQTMTFTLSDFLTNDYSYH